MLHKMKLSSVPFDAIASEKKTIELRLFDEKRQALGLGDTIEFTCTDGRREFLCARITALHRFTDFAELYRALPLLKCGYTAETVASASPRDMEQYYTPEEQKNYGVLAIEFALLNKIAPRPLGINMDSVPGLSDEANICAIGEAGFGAVFSAVYELDRQCAVAELCRKHHLRYETLHAPFRGINQLWLPGEAGDAMLAELIRTVDHCAAAGIPMAVVHLSSGKTPPQVTEIGADRFTKLMDYALEKNITVCFENQRMMFNLAWAYNTFGLYPNFGFCWDCGHESCFTPGVDFLSPFGDRLRCVHLHDNFGKFDEDSHLIPYDGTMDFDKIATRLANYHGEYSIMLELSRAVGASFGDPVTFLRRAAASAERIRLAMNENNQ